MSNARPEVHFPITSATADDTPIPVQIQGVAAADCTGNPPVTPGESVALVADVNGRLITVAIGNVPADDPDACNPVKIGARASADSTTGHAAVAANDRVNIAADPNGRLLAMAQGNVASDAVDAGFPVKIGSIALTEAPTLVAALDRVNAYGDLAGRQQVNQELPMAGENIVLGYRLAMKAKSPFSQDAWIGRDLGSVSSAVMKPLPGRLARFQAFNEGATGLYVLLHDNTVATALSALITSPIKWRGFVPAAAGGVPGVLDIGFEEMDGIFFTLGICFSTSTSGTAIAGAANVTAGCYII